MKLEQIKAIYMAQAGLVRYCSHCRHIDIIWPVVVVDAHEALSLYGSESEFCTKCEEFWDDC